MELMEDIERAYGLTCTEFRPVSGGWLNEKWRAETELGPVLVKKFSPRRYGNARRLAELEAALQRQALLYDQGVPCPKIFLWGGKALRPTEDGTAYMVMEFRPGQNVSGGATLPQLESLGDACGRMKRAFSQLPFSGVKGWPVTGGQTLAVLKSHLEKIREERCPDEAFQQAAALLEPIMRTLGPEFFCRLQTGIGHEDFTWDNLLFSESALSAIIDFDRNAYGYVLHDVGRALLCFALEGEELNMEKVDAFARGYRRHLPLTGRDLSDALKISWCVEVPWWIRPEYFSQDRGKAGRFRDEILWVTRHWFRLDGLMNP